MTSRLFACTILIAVMHGSSMPAHGEPQEAQRRGISDLVERPSGPRGAVNPRLDANARSPSLSVVFGFYTSVQVNVDVQGQNIVGDAANEPSIAVSPTNPSKIVIGWRQFNTITSDFREAGWSYTTDAGATWTFPGSLEPGIFRSDPVLGSDSSGYFYYQSLTVDATRTNISVDVFQSTDGGVTWPVKAASFGGDKPWMVIDKSGAASDGHIYGIWNAFDPNVLTRSTNGGASFETPVAADLSPAFGTMAVGPDGVLYMGGIDGTGQTDIDTFVVSRSTDAANPAVTPTSTAVVVDMGGSMAVGGTPNPGGLMGQADVAVDLSNGPSHGNVYLLSSAVGFLGDPLDVHFVRSVDGGATWSSPVRVNDDLSLTNWQWFGAIDVASNGRIDAIWNDTRADAGGEISQLFYSYSMDTGQTWAKNAAVSPEFNSTIGYPSGQSKMGDYIDLVSAATGTDVAYAATLNGEQDVYYVRLFPDCNENGIPDDLDLSSGSSPDDDGNGLPDECDFTLTFGGSGAVPDGATIPGVPLTVQRFGSNQLLLSWGPSCNLADTDYAVYEGPIPIFSFTSRRFCTTGGQTSFTMVPLGGNTFYLVVPVNADVGIEGSYGLQSSGVERPAPNGCLVQLVPECQVP